MSPYTQQKFNIAIPPSDKMLLIIFILTAQTVIFPLQITEQCTTKSTQTLLQSLQTQLAYTKTLNDHLSRIILPNSINTSPRIMSPTLFNLIAKLPANNSFTLLTTPSRITPHHLSVQPPHYRYHFSPKILSYVQMSNGSTHYYPSKMILLWSILSFTFLYSKDLQRVL